MIYFLSPSGEMHFGGDYLEKSSLEEEGGCFGYEGILEKTELPMGLYVFVGLNRLGPAAVDFASELHSELEAKTGVTPYNHPEKTLRRYELLRALHEAGINDFRAFLPSEDLSEVRYPVFVRARETDGYQSQLLKSPGAVDRAIGKGIMDGYRLDELLVIEYGTSIQIQGMFRKYSAYVVGDQIVPVSLDLSESWIVRHGVRTPEHLAEEMDLIRENPHEEQLKEIFSLAHTQFGRIDYSFKDGRIQVWEINTAPLLRRPGHMEPATLEEQEFMRPKRELFGTFFSKAMRDANDLVPGGPPVEIQLSDAVRAKAAEEFSSRGVTAEPRNPPYSTIRRMVQPFKKPLKLMTEWALHPLMGRRARRAARR